MARGGRLLPLALSGFAAAGLAGAALVTAGNAGCDDPGSWVYESGRLELVGGCVDDADLPVAPPRTGNTAPAPAVHGD